MSATREDAYNAFDKFIIKYGEKYPKAAECLAKNKTGFLTFYGFLA
jgi:transposase-like protein